MAEPREVELPVCPKCGAIAKIPGRYIGSVKMGLKCMGAEGKGHKPECMELVVFKEVPS